MKLGLAFSTVLNGSMKIFEDNLTYTTHESSVDAIPSQLNCRSHTELNYFGIWIFAPSFV